MSCLPTTVADSTSITATADFADENYIEITEHGLEVRGEVSVEDIVLVQGLWELREAHVGINTAANELTGGATIEILNGVATGQGRAELNWDEGFLDASAEFAILSGFIQMDSAFRADSNYSVTLNGEGTIQIPESFHLGGFADSILSVFRGRSIASGVGYLQYRNDGDDSTNYVAGHARALGMTICRRVTFKGEITPCSSAAPIPHNSPSFDVPAGVNRLLLTAEWLNDVGPVSISIQTPDGTVFDESNIAASVDMDVVDELLGATSKTVEILEPMSGRWEIILSPIEGLVDVDYSA